MELVFMLMELVFMLIVGLVTTCVGFYVGRDGTYADIVAKQRICAKAENAGVKFQKCWKLVEEK